MYKVILADDSSLIREALLQTIPWQELNLQIVGVATNGLEARTMLREQKPDIFISDIRMPGLDGLEVLSETKACGQRLKSILITGFDEFAYAQKALRLGVFDFILKPIRNEELQTVLQRAVRELDEECSQTAFLTHASRLELRHQLASLALGRDLDPAAQQALQEEKRLQHGFLYGIARIRDRSTQKQMAALELLEHQMLRDTGHGIRVLTLEDSIEFLLLFPRGCSSEIAQQQTRKLLKPCSDAIRQQYELEVEFAASNLFEDLNMLPVMRSQARQLMKDSFFKTEEGTPLFKHYTGPSLHSFERLMEEIDHFNSAYLTTTNEKELEQLIDDFLQEVEKYAPKNELSVKYFISEICMECYRRQSGLGTHFNEKNVRQVLEEVDSLNNLRQVRRFLVTFLWKMAEVQAPHYENPVVILAINQIRSQYRDPTLSLTAVAEHLNTSGPYLSRLLKRETGQNFVDILTSVRIETAKRLLKEGNLKIADVGERCGYPNYSYFYQVFKKSENMSPVEWKKKHI